MLAEWGKRIGIALVALLVLAGALVAAARFLEPVNVFYKRMKVSSPYVFEEVDPALTATDPTSLISIRTAKDAAAARTALTGWIYGTEDGTRVPGTLYDPRAGWSHQNLISDWEGFGGVAQYYINVRPDLISYAYLISPAEPDRGIGAGKAVIYHNGMASSFVAARPWLEPFLKAGWTVLAFDQLGYGENTREILCDKPADGAVLPDRRSCIANLQLDLNRINNPVALHVEPVLAGVDLLQSLGFQEIDAFGFSAGAATITFAAAIDPRLRRTVAAAGILPPYLREGQDQLFGIAKELADKGPVSFLDLFVLAGGGPGSGAASGKGRAYRQLFNRFDRCCFRNLKGKHYEDAVKNVIDHAGIGGGFSVVIDESHARHAISSDGARSILDFLRD